MTLDEYLDQKYSKATKKCYDREIKIYLEANPNAKTATYLEVVSYLNDLRSYKKKGAIISQLQGIKKYYNYLLSEEIRADNPAEFIHLKDNKKDLDIIKNRLLTGAELDELWDYFLTKKYRYKLLRNRNITMLGLLLKQALRIKEIKSLKIEDINLEKATVFIASKPRTKERTLSLETAQILPFYHYLNADRKALLQKKTSENTLFINKLGRSESGETVGDLIERAKDLIPSKIVNPQTIRMSVIARQFKLKHSLEEVQYFAGHCKPSTTERYKMNDLEALQESIFRHHPLL